MNEKQFDPKKLQKLNDPQRLMDIPPDYVGEKLHVEKSDVFVEIGTGTAFFLALRFFKNLNLLPYMLVTYPK